MKSFKFTSEYTSGVITTGSFGTLIQRRGPVYGVVGDGAGIALQSTLIDELRDIGEWEAVLFLYDFERML